MESSRVLAWRDAFAEPERWVLGGCLLVLLFLVGRELWTAIDAALYRPATTPAASAQGRDEAVVERITSADLFGHAPQALQPGDASLPQTSLQLTLRGVFTASNPSQASAIIENAEGRAQVVKVGSAVGSETTLQQVYDNRVVLSRNGALENLYFPAPQEGEAGVAVSQDSAAPAGDAGILPADSGSDAGGSPAPSNEDLSAEQKREQILRRLEELRLRSSR